MTSPSPIAMSPLQREVLLLIAIECAGAADYDKLRAAYRKLGPRQAMTVVGELIRMGMVSCLNSGTDRVTWHITDQGMNVAGEILRARAARELLPLQAKYVRLMRWMISRFDRAYCPVQAIEIAAGKRDGLMLEDIAGAVVLTNRKLLEFNAEADACRVSILGRFALELTETISGELFYLDKVPYVRTYHDMIAQHQRPGV